MAYLGTFIESIIWIDLICWEKGLIICCFENGEDSLVASFWLGLEGDPGKSNMVLRSYFEQIL